ncbi:MAG TPA: hypothetical protein DIC35_00625 [Candidatus Moranbacteria bacterium]|nr:hypothetical protein [Candidatus Moranbacteria bacterium]
MIKKNLLWFLLCLSFIFPLKALAYPVNLPTAFPYVSNGTTFDKFVMFHNQSNIYYAIYAATTRDLPHVYTYNGYLRIIFNNSMQGNVLVYRHNGSAWVSYNNMIYDGSPVGIAPGDNCALNPMFFTNTDLVFDSDDIPLAFLGYYKSSTVRTSSYCNIAQPVKGSVFYLKNALYLSVSIESAEGGNVTGSGISCNTVPPGACSKVYGLAEEIALRANANSGHIAYWREGETIINNNDYVSSMQENKNLTAVFQPAFPLNITVTPTDGGYVTGDGILCNYDASNICQYDISQGASVTLTGVPKDSCYDFSHWEVDNQVMEDVDGEISIVMTGGKEVKAVFCLRADDFVFPVLAQGVTDPLLNNTLNPDGNGWHGSDVGELALYEGHLGQDYSVDSGNSAGKPVYAVANGTIVEVMNSPNYSYGWCDGSDHGWGPVVVIRHENKNGFDTTGSIVTATCDTEMSPTVIYSLYGHLSKTSIQNLQVGQTVTKGQPLGVLGTSGTDWSSGINMAEHLHFELKDEVGFNEKAWYKYHVGQCPGTETQSCGAEGVGTGYSYSLEFAPHRYSPDEFILNNQQ